LYFLLVNLSLFLFALMVLLWSSSFYIGLNLREIVSGFYVEGYHDWYNQRLLRSARGCFTYQTLRQRIGFNAANFNRLRDTSENRVYYTDKPQGDSPLPETSFDLLGVYVGGGSVTGPGPLEGIDMTRISIPHWIPTLVFSLLPVRAFVGYLRTRRATRAGHCRRCGYDLRASPDRCPECGLASASPTAQFRNNSGATSIR
jgi:hypothetical protein